MTAVEQKSKKNLTGTIALIVFLIGILMGALDNSIVSPARTLIQTGFKVSANSGIWMITLYSLVFAVSMPLVSKLSDRYGRKLVFVIAISTFGFGSLMVGLTNIIPFMGHFSIFLISRVIQAIGAGGLIPIATAEITYSFPPEKRGLALGMIGGVYGIANIIGPTLGSFILDIAGGTNWGWLFFINVPLTLIAIILSRVLPKHIEKVKNAFDIPGAIVLAVTVSSLLYALTNLNFFDIASSIQNTKVFPFLIIFAVMIPLLIFIESKADDPILNLRYFKNTDILKILILSFTIGAGFIVVIFLPQFAENSLMMKAGSGGYLVTLLAVFSGFSAPASGRLIDKYGAKIILAFGFIFNILGFLVLAFIVPHNLNLLAITAGFMFVGFGMGFTIGAPINYLMLQKISKEDSATGLATIALIRSIGVTLSPGIFINFIVNAGKNVMPNLQKAIPAFSAFPSKGPLDEKTSNLFSSMDVTNVVERFKTIVSDKVPAQGKDKALGLIESSAALIKQIYQKTINEGFTTMFVLVAGISVIGLLILFINKNSKEISPSTIER